jgi:ATP-dependent Clp protease ATP-binding subunit ClpX
MKQYEKLFEMDGITLQVDKAVLDLVIQKAVEFKLGARGLRGICEAILTDAMFDLPGTKDKQLRITLDYAQSKLQKSVLNRLRAA